jgi:type IV pilus assembly protein PilO
MANLRDARRKLRVVMAVLIGINVLLAGALAFFIVRGRALPGTFQELHDQVQVRKANVVPPGTVNDRLKQAREQIAHFYEDRMPNTTATVFDTIGKLAAENNVRLQGANYKVDDTDMPGVRQLTVRASLNGGYTQSMKFINALERNKVFFTVDRVGLAEQNGGQLRLTVDVHAYIRGEA